MFRVAAQGEGLQQHDTRIVTGASESLTAVRELFFGLADIRQDKSLQRSDELMQAILAGFLQAVKQSIQPANDALEFGLVRLHRDDTGPQNETVFEPGLGDGRALPSFAFTERGHLPHSADSGNAVLGGPTQQIGALCAFDAASEVQHVEQVAEVLFHPLVHRVEDLGVV